MLLRLSCHADQRTARLPYRGDAEAKRFGCVRPAGSQFRDACYQRMVGGLVMPDPQLVSRKGTKSCWSRTKTSQGVGATASAPRGWLMMAISPSHRFPAWPEQRRDADLDLAWSDHQNAVTEIALSKGRSSNPRAGWPLNNARWLPSASMPRDFCHWTRFQAQQSEAPTCPPRASRRGASCPCSLIYS